MKALRIVLFVSLFMIQTQNIESWQENKQKNAYRDFEHNAPEHVKEFYKLNHTNQTFDFVLQKKKEYYPLNKGKMSIWQVIDILDSFVDESDPDLDLPQSYHAYQTAEAIRADGHPRWFVLIGFIHDLGKILHHFGEPQWAVVGDTYPVGCAFSKHIVFFDFFQHNPDYNNSTYNQKFGIYKPHCGFDALHFSWGHDEYLYQVVKDYLPEQAAYIIRYHSFYAAHKQQAYQYFMNEYDEKMMKWVSLFSQYDLYSKKHEKIDVEKLKPYYQALVAEFLPDKLKW